MDINTKLEDRLNKAIDNNLKAWGESCVITKEPGWIA